MNEAAPIEQTSPVLSRIDSAAFGFDFVELLRRPAKCAHLVDAQQRLRRGPQRVARRFPANPNRRLKFTFATE